MDIFVFTESFKYIELYLMDKEIFYVCLRTISRLMIGLDPGKQESGWSSLRLASTRTWGKIWAEDDKLTSDHTQVKLASQVNFGN